MLIYKLRNEIIGLTRHVIYKNVYKKDKKILLLIFFYFLILIIDRSVNGIAIKDIIFL